MKIHTSGWLSLLVSELDIDAVRECKIEYCFREPFVYTTSNLDQLLGLTFPAEPVSYARVYRISASNLSSPEIAHYLSRSSPFLEWENLYKLLIQQRLTLWPHQVESLIARFVEGEYMELVREKLSNLFLVHNGEGEVYWLSCEWRDRHYTIVLRELWDPTFWKTETRVVVRESGK